MRIAILIGALLISFAGASEAKQPPLKHACASAARIKTEAQLSAAPGTNVVDVSFVGKRPSSKEIDRVLRDCLATASKIDPSKDVLGTAWFRAKASSNPDDDEVINNYGSLGFLTYVGKTKRIEVHQMFQKQ